MRRLIALVAGALFAAPPASAADSPNVQVRIYDAFGVPTLALAQSRVEATAILQQANVDVAWRDCTDAVSADEDCDRPLRANEFVVRIVPAPVQAPGEVLGNSLIDQTRNTGTLATIFADRVSSLAESAPLNSGTLLGRVVAHELVHLMSATSRHTRRGLMRAQWKDAEIERNLPEYCSLSSPVVRSIRRRLAVRKRADDLLAMKRGERAVRDSVNAVRLPSDKKE